MSEKRPVAESALPIRVIEHEGVVTSEASGLSDGERTLVGWMEDHEPDEEPDEEGEPSPAD